MVSAPRLWRVAASVWPCPTTLSCRPHGFVLTQAHCTLRRYASDAPPDSGKRSLRKVPVLPQTPGNGSLTEDMNEARLERLMEQRPEALLAVNRKLARSSFVYAGLFGLLVFSGAAFLSQADGKSLRHATPGSNPSIKDLRATRNRNELSSAQRSVDKLQKYLDKRVLRYYAKWREAYLNASDGKKAAYMIASINIGVCIAWQISILALRSPRLPNFVPFMMRWFLHKPLSNKSLERSITPITSIFSHNTFTHLLFNNICLVSFATSAGWYISSENVQSGGNFSHGYDEPQELSGQYHFLAFFLTVGVFASLGSTLRAQFLMKRILQSGNPTLEAYRKANTPGLGASGATYAVVVVSTLASPDGRVGIPFLTDLFPILTVEKRYGIMALIGVDIVGLISGWTTFGHAVHLGGAAFGAVYYFLGPRMWATIRGRET